MNHLPLKSSMEAIGGHSKFVADTIAHDTYDDFWKAMSIQEKYAEMDVPAFYVRGSARRTPSFFVSPSWSSCFRGYICSCGAL